MRAALNFLGQYGMVQLFFYAETSASEWKANVSWTKKFHVDLFFFGLFFVESVLFSSLIHSYRSCKTIFVYYYVIKTILVDISFYCLSNKSSL